MKINLTPVDIIAAIKNYLVSTGVDIQDKTITFNFSNKRTKGGVYAEVTIYDDTASPAIAAVAEALAQDAPTEAPQPTVDVPVQQDLPLPQPEPEASVDTPDPIPEPAPMPAPMVNLFG